MEEPLHALYAQVREYRCATLSLRGFDLQVDYCEETGEARFVTPVFSGGNYIPHSVRQALRLDHCGTADDAIEMKLVIDEVRFQVLLFYRLSIPEMTQEVFGKIAEEFLSVADQWRWMLDEYGQHDLVFAHAQS